MGMRMILNCTPMTKGGTPSRVTTLTVFVLIGLIVLAAMGALLWWQQERIAFQPPAPPFPDPGPARRIEYRTDDGVRLFAYVVGDGGTSAVLAFHGNADLAVRQIHWARQVAGRTGRLVVLAEYRGYGGATGAPTYAGSARDARAAWSAVRDTLGIPPDRIALFGHSLGSAVATELASEVQPEVLILQSPFTSARDMARIVIVRPLHVLWNAIARIHFDTESRVRALEVPVWVAHGTRDFIIPVRMGRAVHDAARTKGELLIVPDAGHNDVAETGGNAYWTWIERALGTTGSTGGSRAVGSRSR